MATDWQVSDLGDTRTPAAGPGWGQSVQIEWISAWTAHLEFPALQGVLTCLRAKLLWIDAINFGPWIGSLFFYFLILWRILSTKSKTLALPPSHISLHPPPPHPPLSLSLFLPLLICTFFSSFCQCQFAVLPLGTGNDLARVLGWEASIDDNSSLLSRLVEFEQCRVRMLDRYELIGLLNTISTFPNLWVVEFCTVWLLLASWTSLQLPVLISVHSFVFQMEYMHGEQRTNVVYSCKKTSLSLSLSWGCKSPKFSVTIL